MTRWLAHLLLAVALVLSGAAMAYGVADMACTPVVTEAAHHDHHHGDAAEGAPDIATCCMAQCCAAVASVCPVHGLVELAGVAVPAALPFSFFPPFETHEHPPRGRVPFL